MEDNYEELRNNEQKLENDNRILRKKLDKINKEYKI